MQKQLANGLILRNLSEGISSDRERLPDFNASVNTEGMDERAQTGMRHWLRNLMDGHSTCSPENMFVVVDPAKDDLIVSATLLIPQTWRYAGIPLKVGRPELVATHSEYRGRGLVRALFDAVHERSAALGHVLQGITGIPHFYRQFGYTMAVELDDHAFYHLSTLGEISPEEQKVAVTLRPATVEDIPKIMRWNDQHAAQRLMSDAYSADDLRYEITGRTAGYYPRTIYLVMVDSQGVDVGYMVIIDSLREPYYMRCVAYIVGEDSSYLATFKPSMRALNTWAAGHFGHAISMVQFYPGVHETVDRIIEYSHGGSLGKNEYAWFLRVPDLVGFMGLIKPVLERRLEGSGAHLYTGELRIGFYGMKGIRFAFEGGRITDISNITGKDGYHAEFPWHLFLNVVFGHRTVEELNHILPDAYAGGRASVLLGILFPKQKSWVRGLS